MAVRGGWRKFEAHAREFGHCLKCKLPRVPGKSKCRKHMLLASKYDQKYRDKKKLDLTNSV